MVGGSGTGHDPRAGILYGVLATFAYAGYLLILRHASAGTTHVAGQLFDATAGAAAGALIFGLTLGGLQLAVPLRALGWLLLLSMVVQVAGWILITASLPQLPVDRHCDRVRRRGSGSACQTRSGYRTPRSRRPRCLRSAAPCSASWPRAPVISASAAKMAASVSPALPLLATTRHLGRLRLVAAR